nr:3579_t:CDS:2 [Entrophospora candida]
MNPKNPKTTEHDIIKTNLVPLELNKKNDYDQLIDSIGEAKIVLIGEASHGTEEFYRERCLITKRLIEEKDFTVVACEADWPDSYNVNRYVQNFKTNTFKSARNSLRGFTRFPTWMWRNEQVEKFIEWLKFHNAQLEKSQKSQKTYNRYNKTGFYGLDLYSLFTSIDEVIKYLEKVDKKAAEKAKRQCIQVLVDLVKKRSGSFLKEKLEDDNDEPDISKPNNHDEWFSTEINALVVKDAEEYYRKMIAPEASSWNIRESHMIKILKVLIKYLGAQRGKDVKAVIWAHNSHIGDAKYTDQGQVRRELTIGQLVRENFGPDRTFSIGFTTHTGTVTAASDWNSIRELKKVNPSRPNSYENLFHKIATETNHPNFLLLFKKIKNSSKLSTSPELINALSKPNLMERAIGVIYRPNTELQSHYFYAQISSQFDSVIHIDTTSALKALDVSDLMVRDFEKEAEEPPETYPTVVAALGALDSLDAHNVLVDYVDCVVADDDADDVQQKALDQYIK